MPNFLDKMKLKDARLEARVRGWEGFTWHGKRYRTQTRRREAMMRRLERRHKERNDHE